jgi:hypothetical protein
MKRLGALLGSAARTEILRALLYQPDAIGLRQAARIAGVLPRSAQLALAGLVAEDLVNREKTADQVNYRLNRAHPASAVLQAVFDAATRESIRADSRQLNKRALALLPFMREARQMLNHARRGRDVP